MMRETRLRSKLTLNLFLIFGFLAIPASSSAQSDAEIVNCGLNYWPWECVEADNAGNWAREQTDRLFYITGLAPGVDGDMGNAFQHCAGSGALATRVGYDTAVAIGEDHEFITPNSYNLSDMDRRNNEIGARIGVDAVEAGYDDTWGYVMKTCETMARNGALYGPCGKGEYLTTAEPGSQDPGRILECPSPGNLS